MPRAKKLTRVEELAALILSRLPEVQKAHLAEVELLLAQGMAIALGTVPVAIVEGWLDQSRRALEGSMLR